MRWLGAASGLVAAALTGTSVGAQLAPRAPVIAEFGACIVRQFPDRARALLETAMDTPREATAARSVAMASSACVRSNGLSMQTGEVRGIVATALLQGDAGRMAALRALPSQPAVRAQGGEGRRFIINYSRCITQAEPAKAADIVATQHQSEEERRAILALGTTLIACVPEGVQYRLDRFDLRNHLAAHLYTIASSAAVGGSSR